MSNKIDYDNLRRLDKAATPGPWDWSDGEDDDGTNLGYYEVLAVEDEDGETVFTAYVATHLDAADAEFIAEARTAVPTLLDELEHVKAERDGLEADFDTLSRLYTKAKSKIEKLEEARSNAGWAADMDRQGGA